MEPEDEALPKEEQIKPKKGEAQGDPIVNVEFD
jgi:hypothetical protein